MPLAVGSKLAFYEVLAPLGAGAMGEVWRAKDTKLGREVAIKVLPDAFASDAERLRRFEREAKTLATVNHPNVAQIFGVDRVGETSFLVLELVPGESLADRLKRGPLPLAEAIDVCRQIAEGLEAAHEAGVIHRDLKPANIRITPEGKVKLLDFGLAKPVRADGDVQDSTDSVLSTEQGRLLGTPTYMAPEQARGKPIDKRVDIWAFGCVLYECLTKKRAFAGATLADVLGAVMHTEPDWKALPSDTPPHIRELLSRCLAKDPRQRLRDIGDSRILIDLPRQTPVAKSRSHRLVLAVAVLAAILAFVAGMQRDPPPKPVVRTHVILPAECTPGSYDGGSLVLSPDGRSLLIAAYTSTGSRLWIRPLDGLEARPIPGTEGAIYPFWSPDGSSIGFFANGKLKRIGPTGGSATTICDAAAGRGGSWSRAGQIAFAPESEGPLSWVSAAGGQPARLTEARPGTTHRRPCFLPDGRHLLFTDQGDEEGGIVLLDTESGATARVVEAGSEGIFVPPNKLLFVRKGSLVVQPFDLGAGTLAGEAQILAEDVVYNLMRMTGIYSVSSEGTLAYLPESTPLARMEWLDRDGHTLGSLGTPARFVRVRLSPDGRRIAAVLARSGGERDLWLFDAESGLGSRLVEDIAAFADESVVAWSPDSRRIAYTKWENRAKVHVCSADGALEDRVLGDGHAYDWSRDGAWISVTGMNALDRNAQPRILAADGTGEPRTIVSGSQRSQWPCFSPDGRWSLVLARPTGRKEAYLAPFPGPGPLRALTSTGVEGRVTWLDDGRIVYTGQASQFFELQVPKEDEFSAIGTPQPILGERRLSEPRLSFSRDGKRILAAVPLEADAGTSVTIVQNWPASIGLE